MLQPIHNLQYDAQNFVFNLEGLGMKLHIFHNNLLDIHPRYCSAKNEVKHVSMK